MAIAWNVSIINLESKTLISGSILKASPFTFSQETGKFKNALYLVKTYFIPVLKSTNLFISANGQSHHTSTDAKGGFKLVLDSPVLEMPTISSANDEAIEIVQNYPVVFDYRDSEFNIISDFDDTLMVSHTASLIKRVKSMALITPSQRKPIEFTHHIVTELKKRKAGIFYLSKSESNLFGMLTSFLKHYKLPDGALVLSPYLKLIQLLNPRKGKNYKLDFIRFCFDNTEQKKFILFGDDSQRDMEIYTTVALQYPNRIFKIYIRKTMAYSSSKQKQQWENIMQTGVPASYFNANDDFKSEQLLTLLKN